MEEHRSDALIYDLGLTVDGSLVFIGSPHGPVGTVHFPGLPRRR
jgi:hypothetical protein